MPGPIMTVPAGVSACTHVGTSVPIKRKRDSVETPSEGSPERLQDEEIGERPVKRRKEVGGKTIPGLVFDPATYVSPRAAAKQSQKPKKKRSTGPIHDIMTGKKLPKNRQQALDAQRARLKALAKRLGGPTTVSSEEMRSDAMRPEFFDMSDFPEAASDNEACRCICLDDNPHLLYVSCDVCGVWQHPGCMGKAVPKSAFDPLPEIGVAHKVNTDLYRCHVCDPWIHRRLLADLRLKNPLKRMREEGGN